MAVACKVFLFVVQHAPALRFGDAALQFHGSGASDGAAHDVRQLARRVHRDRGDVGHRFMRLDPVRNLCAASEQEEGKVFHTIINPVPPADAPSSS